MGQIITNEPAVVKRMFDLSVWFLKKIDTFPRTRRYTLGSRIENCVLECTECLLEAGYSRKKKELLESVNRLLNRLRMLCRLAVEVQCLTTKNQEFVAKEVDEIGRQVGGWLKSLKDG